MFLVNHDIHSAEELVSVISSLTDKRKEVSAEKSRIYKARERSRELFDIADDMKELEPAEKSFLQGDEFFTDEHLQWETLKQKLLSQGYSLEEVEALRKFLSVIRESKTFLDNRCLIIHICECHFLLIRI